jgi:hypothetical protein
LLLKIVDNRDRCLARDAEKQRLASPSAINKHCPPFKSRAAPTAHDRAMPHEPSVSQAGDVNLAPRMREAKRELEATQAHMAGQTGTRSQQAL